MNAEQLFATGGVSGATALGFYLVYRFFFSKHRIASKCCGKEFSLEVEQGTPKENPMRIIDEHRGSSSSTKETTRQTQEDLHRGRTRSNGDKSDEQEAYTAKENT